MPSKDPINEKANAWMEGENLEIGKGVSASTPKVKPVGRKMAAQVQRLARRLGVAPDELAERMPEDTVRRLKYPVLERVNEDGSRTFEHDIGIKTDGRLSRP